MIFLLTSILLLYFFSLLSPSSPSPLLISLPSPHLLPLSPSPSPLLISLPSPHLLPLSSSPFSLIISHRYSIAMGYTVLWSQGYYLDHKRGWETYFTAQIGGESLSHQPILILLETNDILLETTVFAGMDMDWQFLFFHFFLYEFYLSIYLSFYLSIFLSTYLSNFFTESRSCKAKEVLFFFLGNTSFSLTHWLHFINFFVCCYGAGEFPLNHPERYIGGSCSHRSISPCSC